ncbi:MAG TPA: DUF2961 domain-containing protein [Polyangiaceae bacterium]|nr:DUF2961 domain-containing protein [Polyangiaceae bacterium]
MREGFMLVAASAAALFLTRCGTDPVVQGAPSYAQVTPDAGAAPDAGPARDAEVTAAPGLSNTPPSEVGAVGLAALTAFSDLPYLHTAQHSRHESSFDRTGGNYDFAGAGNYLYTDANGETVLMDAMGPGCVYRMWFTGMDAQKRIHIYFDGESSPRVDMTFGDLFSGTKSPFLSPLVANSQVSSGGSSSYVPLPFSKSIRITATTSEMYYNIDYHVSDSSSTVTTFTGNEDSSAARALWKRTGSDPKDNPADTQGASATIALEPGRTETLLDVDGPRQISRIEMSIAGVVPSQSVAVDDAGRAHTGSSRFTVAVDPANEGVVLQRRLNHAVADQVADVYVDGALAGTWADRGSDATNSWRDDFFPIPKKFTAGKSKVTVRIQFKSSSKDYTEFFYWIYSRLNGAEVLTDEIDVGTASSESAHGYSIRGQTWQGEEHFHYPSPSQYAATLNALWLRITWNGDSQPSVDAPLGSFFAQGQFGPAISAGLGAGMNPDGTMYLFFPMPFQAHAKIELVNRGSARVDDIWYDVEHAPFAGPFDDVGTFHASFNVAQPSTDGVDLVYLDTEGAGQVVGVVESQLAWAKAADNIPSLEGDERALIDDRRTPSIHGTGTEDFFNGGYYFSNGTFSLPMSGLVQYPRDLDATCGGLSKTDGDTICDGRAMVRFFVSDAIPFQKHIHLSREHGAFAWESNETKTNAWSLAYYYYQPTPRIQLSDSITIGDPASESGHAYDVASRSWEGPLTSSFEGEFDTVMSTSTGRSHKGSSRFTLTINPSNRGVVLRRLLDQGVGGQLAHLYVNGNFATDWYTPASNDTHRWREDEVLLPSTLTANHSSIRVVIESVPAVDYMEFEYRAYSITE